MPYPTSPEFQGPYDPGNGADAYGHSVNGFGRCQYLNSAAPGTTPPGCPRRPERAAEMATMSVDNVVSIANILGVAIPPLLSGTVLRTALIPLILLAEGYPAP